MDQYTIEKKLIEAVTNIEKYGVEYAVAKGKAYQLGRMREVVLAMEMKNYTGTNAYRQMEALRSPKYILHLEGTAEAITDEQKTRALFERWKAQQETLRSLLSLEKQKAKIL